MAGAVGVAGPEPLQYAKLRPARRLFPARRPAEMGRPGPYRRQTPGIGQAEMVGPGPLAHQVLLGTGWRAMAANRAAPSGSVWLLIILGAFLLNPAEVLPPEFLNNLAGYQDNVVHLIALRLIVSFYNFVSAIPGWGGHLSLASPEFHLFVFLWFQRICGWILIPIGLAAVYTRLK